jgi:hypothetical protein
VRRRSESGAVRGEWLPSRAPRPPKRRAVTWTKRLVGAVALVTVLVVAGAFVHAGLLRAGLLPRSHPYVLRGDIELARSDRTGVRVLFVGNSFTFANAMPAVVSRLARGDAGAPPIFAVQYVAPGGSLSDAAKERRLSALLREVRWDVVVLQEQSRLPSRPLEERREDMHPAVQALHARSAASGARTLLFMTWGYVRGDSFPLLRRDSFPAMQERIWKGYYDVAMVLRAPPARVGLAPVGLAWAEAIARNRHVPLWARDGRHPSPLGSYLAACVIYVFLTGRDPSGSEYMAGLAPSDARQMQDVARDIVMQWKLGRIDFTRSGAR